MLAPLSVSVALLAATPGAKVWSEYQEKWSGRLTPLLSEVLRFPTLGDDTQAIAAQRAWLDRVGGELGFTVRHRETMSEVDLPGPPGAPILGLVVHGDVQPVNPAEWTVPPFSGVVKDGQVWGRGAADDKGPLVQALLVMAALRSSQLPRTHTVRLLVGTDEERGATDVEEYVKKYPLPDLALVLDSDFPVVVGEKAWAEWLVSARERPSGQGPGPVEVVELVAGLSTGIVPDHAALTLQWRKGTPEWDRWLQPILAVKLPPGTTLEVQGTGDRRTLVTHGRAAHAGTSLAQGRNALVALAIAVDGRLPTSAAADLLAYAKQAGRDTHGGGLGLTVNDPLWGGVDTNVARVMREGDGPLTLVINLRSPPPFFGDALKQKVEAHAQSFAAARGARFEFGGKFIFPPYVVAADSPLVKRLLAAYARGTGVQRGPVVSAGGTYAQRLKNGVAFGMWFAEDGPYPGHAADERNPIASLTRGVHVLSEALGDLATSPPMENPLQAPAAKSGTR